MEENELVLLREANTLLKHRIEYEQQVSERMQREISRLRAMIRLHKCTDPLQPLMWAGDDIEVRWRTWGGNVDDDATIDALVTARTKHRKSRRL